MKNEEFLTLLKIPKEFIDNSMIDMPEIGGKVRRFIRAKETPVDFILDITRGRINEVNITYFIRQDNQNKKLLRLDITDKLHINPDGEHIRAPHIHLADEGWDLKWAYPLDNAKVKHIFSNRDDMIALLQDLLKYFTVENIPLIVLQSNIFSKKW
ncbi:MAG: hypothetical protein FWF59_05350 [Turicibacter sp.]|nr:hypothetical protein [Turicibacter sp.]